MKEAQTLASMKVVVAAGGLRSRKIHPVNVSKAFYPIINKPAVHYTLNTLCNMGISDVFLAFGNEDVDASRWVGSFNGLQVHSFFEDYPLGTAGALKQFENHLNGHTVILISASLLFFAREDLEEIVRYHLEQRADLTVGMMPVSDAHADTERIVLGPGKEIDSIVQIHASVDRRSKLKTSGVYVLESHVLEHVRPGGFVDMKEQLIPKLREQGMKVIGWTHRRNSWDVRNMGDYLRINFELLRDSRWVSEHLKDYRQVKPQVWVGKNVDISPSAKLIRPLVIGNDSRIEDDVDVVGPSVIGERCLLGRNSLVRESVLWPGSTVGAGMEIERCLVSGRAHSEQNSHCHERIVLDGESHIDGISAGIGRPRIRGVVEKPVRGLAKAKRIYSPFKRLYEIVISALSLALLAPLFALIAIAIKIDSKGPVFFVQTRCGKNGKPFHMLKFRTMVANAEQIKEKIRHLNQADGPMFKIVGDPRVTRVGRFLRATNLDELPQLVNVLRGEMSFVGPRPLSMEEMKYNPHWRDARLNIRPGVTGFWQLYGKPTNSFHDWIRYDLKYVDERSFWLDMKLIFATVLKAVKSR